MNIQKAECRVLARLPMAEAPNMHLRSRCHIQKMQLITKTATPRGSRLISASATYNGRVAGFTNKPFRSSPYIVIRICGK